MTAALINHLWQSTLFVLGAGLLTLALKRNGARFRYGLWFAASVKFLIPFAVLGAAGSWMVTRMDPLAQAPAGLRVVRQVVAPFVSAPAARSAAQMIAASPSVVAHTPYQFAAILLVFWALGAAAVLTVWALRWRRVRAALLASSPLALSTRVPARSSPSLLEPGVVGVFRQVLMFPMGIEDHLSIAEMEAVLAHELCHLRRRDNLTAAIHMLVEALFWFHPLVWWIGGRLIAERERACDEGVIEAGVNPRVYAEGILKVCRFYLQSPLACAAGVSGSNLKRRMEMIMTGSSGAPLGVSKTLLVSTAAVLAVAAPLAAGLIAAVPAAARTAILDRVGLMYPAPALAASDVPISIPGQDDAAPTVDVEAREKHTIAQSLKQDVEIVTAPGNALALAMHVDEPIAAPELHLVALAAPALAGGAGTASGLVPPSTPTCASSHLTAPCATAAPNRGTLAVEIDNLHARIEESSYPLQFDPGRELYLFVKSAPPSSYSNADIKLLGRELFYYRSNLEYSDTASLRHYAAESLGYIGQRAIIVRDDLQLALRDEGCNGGLSYEGRPAAGRPAILTVGVIPDAMRRIGIQPQPIDCANFDGRLPRVAAR